MPFSTPRLRWISPLLLGAALLGPATAWAGDVKFGTEPLAVDDGGNITAEGKSAAVNTIPSEPGEEVWPFHLWAKIDKGGPGPLYVEFIGKLPGGKEYVTYRYEHGSYDGEKFVSLSFDLEGNLGFNKGKTYKVKVLQGNTKPGKPDIILATGSITLEYTEPPAEAEEEGDEGGDTDGDTAAQDELDTLAGPDEEVGDAPQPEGPPPVAEKKKGCSVGGDLGLPAVAALFALGLVRRRND